MQAVVDAQLELHKRIANNELKKIFMGIWLIIKMNMVREEYPTRTTLLYCKSPDVGKYLILRRALRITSGWRMDITVVMMNSRSNRE